MRVVGLSSSEWAGRYLFHELALSKVGLTDVVFERDPLDRARFSVKGAVELANRYGRVPAARAFFGLHAGLRKNIPGVRSKRDDPAIDLIRNTGTRVHLVSDARSPECQSLLGSLHPDIVVICGTAILPERILEIARICTLNIHTSILPHYRGGGSLFWPLFFRDTEPVGFTIHQAVAKVDAGQYLVQEQIHVKAGDSPDSLLRRCFRAAAPRLREVLREFENGCQPQ